jgi:hypothetical protein
MINIRPVNPADVVGDPETSIAYFTDVEWGSLIALVRRHGFYPSDLHAYDHPVAFDAEASQALWTATRAAYRDDEVASNPLLKARVAKLMGCAQIGAEHGGIEILREHEFS